jgi:hypothetical protein
MMKKIALPLIAALILGACLPLPFTPTPGPNVPTVDVAGTVQAGQQTSVAQTLTALPTITVAPVTDTATPPVAQSTDTATGESPTATFIPNLTTTPATSTSAPTDSAFTSTATLAPAPGGATLTPTLGILTYGTLPPAVPYATVILVNKAKAQAYISLQVTTVQGGPTIIEYPVEGRVKILAPVGEYLYVAWVGGRKMVGNFRLRHDDELTITLYKDKVVIQ